MITVDARGHLCPTPSLRLRRALEQAGPGRMLTLLATDPMARVDVPYLLAALPARLISVEEVGGVLSFVVETLSPASDAAPTG